jgi:hypothetical protein
MYPYFYIKGDSECRTAVQCYRQATIFLLHLSFKNKNNSLNSPEKTYVQTLIRKQYFLFFLFLGWKIMPGLYNKSSWQLPSRPNGQNPHQPGALSQAPSFHSSVYSFFGLYYTDNGTGKWRDSLSTLQVCDVSGKKVLSSRWSCYHPADDNTKWKWECYHLVIC